MNEDDDYNFDDELLCSDGLPTPMELQERYKEFLKANAPGSLNNSYDSNSSSTNGDKFLALSSICNERYTHDIDSIQSTIDDTDVKKCIRNNQALHQQIGTINQRYEGLRVALESKEDENQQLVEKLLDLEKRFNTAVKDREFLNQELMKLELVHENMLQEKHNVDHELKCLRSEQKDHSKELNTMRDKIDDLTCEIQSYKHKFDALNCHHQKMKTQHEGLQEDFLEKVKDVNRKDSMIEGLTDQVEYYQSTIETLKQKEEQLTFQLNENLFDCSYFLDTENNGVVTPTPSSPHQNNLLCEINQAQLAPSPGVKRLSLSACASPREIRKSLFGGRNSTVTASATQTSPGRCTLESEQNPCANDNSCSDDPNLVKEVVSSLVTDVVNKQLQEKVNLLEGHLQKASRECSQLSVERSDLLDKVEQSRVENKKSTQQILLLSDMNSKLSLGKLSLWHDDYITSHDDLDSSLLSISVPEDSELFSRSLDALNLVGFECSSAAKLINCEENALPACLQQIMVANEEDEATVSNRLLALQKCTDMLRQSMDFKIKSISSALNDIETDVSSFSKFSRATVADDVAALRNYAERLAKLSVPIGSLQKEKSYVDVINYMINLNRKTVLEQRLPAQLNSDHNKNLSRCAKEHVVDCELMPTFWQGFKDIYRGASISDFPVVFAQSMCYLVKYIVKLNNNSPLQLSVLIFFLSALLTIEFPDYKVDPVL